MLESMDIILIIFFFVIAVFAGLYFLNRWAGTKMTEQQSIIERTRTTTTIYVIDKKKEKITNVNLPKAAMAQLPKWYRFMKMPFVKAKVGPQIITLMCDKKVYEALPVKKSVKVGLAGIYIVDMVGMKSQKEMKAKKKAKEQGEKAGKKSLLDTVKSKISRK